MPPKTSSALSSTTPFLSPLGILNSASKLSKLRGSLQFAQPFTKSLGDAEKPGFVNEIRNALESELREPDGSWYADYVRLRFKAEVRHTL
jgi:hypothetical protein